MVVRRSLRGAVLVSVFLLGCVAIGGVQLSQRFGEPAPKDRVVASLGPSEVDYWTEVQPILDRRCVVCHGCYDAPCQLKLQSIEGIDRGASHEPVYAASRLVSAAPSRLYEDASTTAAWRKRGFYPVLNEHADSLEANREAGVMYRMLELKRHNPLPTSKQLSPVFDVPVNRGDVCPSAEDFDLFAQQYPLWGMPYALPGLATEEQATLKKWLEQGARHSPREPMDDATRAEVERWEKFLNSGSLRGQLVARYVFEHLFLAHLHFTNEEPIRWFRLVRSKTPPGEPLERIVTARPFDDPGVETVYYRLVEDPETVVDKTHMPYLLDDVRMERWLEYFDVPEYQVTELPSYAPEVASNPVLAFQAIPMRSRYRFLLDDARFTLMNFIKGPVCRGQVALNVINDRFWVFFLDPDLRAYEEAEPALRKAADLLSMPAQTESDIFRPLSHWRQFEKNERKFLEVRARFVAEQRGGTQAIDLDAIWDGDGENPNAALTIFRHFDSATVEQGLIGEPPKTAWVISYTLLERIHYLLVAGFDVYGNAGHQLITRNYMDFLRMEGESAFLYFLPESARKKEREFWYREASKEVVSFLEIPRPDWNVEPSIAYRTDDPKLEFYAMLRDRLEPVIATDRDIESLDDPVVREQLARLMDLQGGPVTLLPQIALVEIRGDDASETVTLIRDNAHNNISSVFRESSLRVPEEDRLTVARGVIGSYPNALFLVPREAVEAFVDEVIALETEADYRAVFDRFGVRRTNRDFWSHSDALHRGYREREPVRWGWLDYSRLENR